ncbi:MAG: GntR family transcriptional regulator [Oscillospiraceae bacterium]
MKILQNSEVPIYRQIATQFKDDIMNGVIHEGDYLPSIRGLARDLKISVITTMKAYELLSDEGLISPVQGKGYIVNPQDREMVREQHLRLLEQHLQNAMESAKLAGVSREELVKMLTVLYDTEQ